MKFVIIVILVLFFMFPPSGFAFKSARCKHVHLLLLYEARVAALRGYIDWQAVFWGGNIHGRIVLDRKLFCKYELFFGRKMFAVMVEMSCLLHAGKELVITEEILNCNITVDDYIWHR